MISFKSAVLSFLEEEGERLYSRLKEEKRALQFIEEKSDEMAAIYDDLIDAGLDRIEASRRAIHSVLEGIEL